MHEASAYDLPFEDGTLDVVYMITVFQEIPDRDRTLAEVMRVLCPGGVAYIGEGGRWAKTVMPWPKTMDEWTHFLHDASNNAVAHDRQVGPPRHLQWQCGPRWSRHHDHMASMSAAVPDTMAAAMLVPESSNYAPSQ